MFCLNGVSKGLRPWAIREIGLNNYIVKSTSEGSNSAFNVLAPHSYDMRCESEFFYDYLSAISTSVHFCAVPVLTEQTAILVSNSNHIVFSDHHSCSSDGVSFFCAGNALKISECSVFKGSLHSFIVCNDPFKCLLWESCTNTIREQHFCISIRHLSDDYSLFCNNSVELTTFFTQGLFLHLLNVTSAEVLNNQSVFEGKCWSSLALAHFFVVEELVEVA